MILLWLSTIATVAVGAIILAALYRLTVQHDMPERISNGVATAVGFAFALLAEPATRGLFERLTSSSISALQLNSLLYLLPASCGLGASVILVSFMNRGRPMATRLLCLGMMFYLAYSTFAVIQMWRHNSLSATADIAQGDMDELGYESTLPLIECKDAIEETVEKCRSCKTPLRACYRSMVDFVDTVDRKNAEMKTSVARVLSLSKSAFRLTIPSWAFLASAGLYFVLAYHWRVPATSGSRPADLDTAEEADPEGDS